MPSLSSDWAYRFYVVVPAALQDAANEQAAQIDPDSGGMGTFSTPLSADGNEPATYYGTSTLTTQTGHDAIIQIAPQMVGASYFCVDANTSELLATNTPVELGQAWDYWKTLDYLNLKLVSQPIEIL